jgi:hypothetical protein
MLLSFARSPPALWAMMMFASARNRLQGGAINPLPGDQFIREAGQIRDQDGIGIDGSL